MSNQHAHQRTHVRKKTRSLLLSGAAALGAIALTFSGAAAANAHISVNSDNPAAGSNTVLTFSVPHGCGLSATTEIAIQMPEGVTGVQPIRQPFYEVESVWETFETPAEDGHGNTVTERIAEVIYTATTPLPSELRDDFRVAVQLPEDAAGGMIHFPILQTCEEGDYAWIQIPAEGQDPHDLDSPAPGLAVTEATGGGQGHGASDGHGDDEADDSDATSDSGNGSDSDSDGTANDAESAAQAESGSDQTPLIITALAVGGLGLIAGVIALFRGRQRA